MSVKNDFIMPIVVLLFICLVVSGALAIVNSITEPVIAEAAQIREAEQKESIMGEGVTFETLDIDFFRSISGFPRTVTDIYRATNNAGYIFAISVRGFGTEDMKLLCGIDMNGRILEADINAIVLSHTETISFFNRVFNERYVGQYWGRDRRGIEEIDVISGATITSNALKNAMRYALIAFEIVTTNQGVRYE